MDFNRWNKIIGWSVFAITFVVYFLTAQRTISFWDSPEFISAAYKLQVSHPPGAPLYALLARVFMLFFPQSMIAFAGSLFSVLCASLTTLLLHFSITHIGRLLLNKEEPTDSENIAILASGLIGALSLVFTHSYWTASTEAEVYTLASLLLAISFWASLKWEAEKNATQAVRWLLLIAFTLGLSVGVHIMNFAIVFPIAMIFVLKKYGFNWKWLSIAFGAGLAFFFLLKNVLVTGFLAFASKLELLVVNSYGMPVNSGLVVAVILLIALASGGLYYTKTRRKIAAHHIILAVSLFMIGWSSYGMALVRSMPDLAVSSAAGDPFRLNGYLQADQFDFGVRPLLKGPVYNSPLDPKKPFVDGDEIYSLSQEEGKYIRTNTGKYTETNFDKRFDMFFPRVYNARKVNSDGYRLWASIEGEPIQHTANGKTETIYRPTFAENLTYFFKFQLIHLNWRYFMWNFAGSQNRAFDSGDPARGNWMSGIGLIDYNKIGNTDLISERNMNDKSRNNFYLLPFLLGVFGLVFLFIRHKRYFAVTLIFFLAFSVAITIFINQMPIHLQIRDRDYIFLAAYFMFCLWIGLGVLGLFKMIPKLKENNTKAILAAALTFLAVPFQMGAKGWDDHDRSSDDFLYTLGKAYLDACPPNTILITEGDNATFPLWYLQEVEGYRTDVRVINYELLNLDNYIYKLRRQIYDSPPVKMSLPESSYIKGVDKLLPLIDKVKDEAHADVGQVVAFASSPNNQTRWNGRDINYIPTTRFSLKADTNQLRARGVVPEKYDCRFVPEIKWEFAKDFYSIADLALLDILSSNNWERPICFTNLDYSYHMIGLKWHLVKKGMVEELLPIEPGPEKDRDLMFDIETMEKGTMTEPYYADFSDPSGNYSFESQSTARYVLRHVYFFLADAYLEQGDSIAVGKVLDKCIELMPDESVEYRKYMFDIGKTYYKIGQPERAREVINKLMDNLFTETHHGLSFTPVNKWITRKHMENNIYIMGVLAKELQARDKELGAIVQPKYELLDRELQVWIKQNF